MVSINVCRRYLTYERKNRDILIIKDHYTKWVEAYAMSNKVAITIDFSLEQFIDTFGYPDNVFTD